MAATTSQRGWLALSYSFIFLLKTTQIYPHTVLEVKNPKSVSLGQSRGVTRLVPPGTSSFCSLRPEAPVLLPSRTASVFDHHLYFSEEETEAQRGDNLAPTVVEQVFSFVMQC